MPHENPYALGNLALGCDGCYNADSHGSPSATYESLINADIPSYAHGFYSPTEHEALSDIRYNRTEIGYDRNMREIKEAIDGAPIEAYIPGSFEGDSGASAVPKTGEVIEPIIIKNPNQDIINEIIKAQKEVAGREIILRELEIEEIIIKRRVRKREVKITKNK